MPAKQLWALGWGVEGTQEGAEEDGTWMSPLNAPSVIQHHNYCISSSRETWAEGAEGAKSPDSAVGIPTYVNPSALLQLQNDPQSLGGVVCEHQSPTT